MNVAEVLRAAADHIERVGHYRGGLFANWEPGYRKNASCCALGAVLAVLPDYDYEWYADATHALAAEVGIDIGSWSDSQESERQVAEGLRRAADRWEASP